LYISADITKVNGNHEWGQPDYFISQRVDVTVGVTANLNYLNLIEESKQVQ
jgi:hypothetical protein